MEHEETERYDPEAVEAKWQAAWAAEGAFEVANPDVTARAGRPSTYVLEMLPYPSGELHMGHVFNYTLGDVFTHVRRRQGFTVLRPRGYDSFGLNSENAAIKEGGHPREITKRNIEAIRRADEARWAGRSTGRARSRPRSPSTTGGRNGCSSSSSSAGSRTVARRPSSGARRTRPCSRTSR